MFNKKLDTDPYLDLLAELDSKIYQELLIEFLNYPRTKEAISRHEVTPGEILKVIADDGLSIIGDPILTHPNCPPEIIEQKLIDGSQDELLQLAKNPSLTDDQIRKLAKSSYSPILVWVCRRPDCPSDVLDDLFKLYEQQLQQQSASIAEMNQEEVLESLIDDEVILEEIDSYGIFDVDVDLLLAVASNHNTSHEIFKKMLKLNLNQKDVNNDSLGVVLLNNPSVSDEDKVFLSLSGFVKSENSSNQDFSLLKHYGYPSSIAFSIPNFPMRFKQALAQVGHPLAIFDSELTLSNQKYVFNEIIDDWIKDETIYSTLWPELSERNDVKFGYLRSSYDGDHFYFDCTGVEFEHDFSRGSYTYNSMSYPFNDRPWAEIVETMDIEMSHENFSYRDVVEFFEYLEGEEGETDLILAAIISQNLLSQEGKTAEYLLTKKGESFVCERAEEFFSDDLELKVNINSEKALPYSWRALSIERKEKIMEIIIEGFQEKIDTKFQYAEHFLACIALNPYTPDSLKNELKKLESKVVTQALAIS